MPCQNPSDEESLRHVVPPPTVKDWRHATWGWTWVAVTIPFAIGGFWSWERLAGSQLVYIPILTLLPLAYAIYKLTQAQNISRTWNIQARQTWRLIWVLVLLSPFAGWFRQFPGDPYCLVNFILLTGVSVAFFGSIMTSAATTARSTGQSAWSGWAESLRHLGNIFAISLFTAGGLSTVIIVMRDKGIPVTIAFSLWIRSLRPWGWVFILIPAILVVITAWRIRGGCKLMATISNNHPTSSMAPPPP